MSATSPPDAGFCDAWEWSKGFSGPPVLCGEPARWKGARVCRWTDTSARMPQPPLNHHVVVLHLGGDKRVQRSGAGSRSTNEVANGALTIIPAGWGFEWVTEGPIDFAHLYVSPERLNQTVAMVFDRDPSGFVLHDPVGVVDPLARELMSAILTEFSATNAPRAYLDGLLEAMLARIVQQHSNIGGVVGTPRQALAPVRLKRVLEHIETALVTPLDLQELAAVAGLSRFHFSRAFQQSVGRPPLAYVASRRIEAAKALLRETGLPITDIAARAGFNSVSYFSNAFRRANGRSPSEYRYERSEKGAKGV